MVKDTDSKSTTTGRLLFELGGISEREMEKLRKEADEMGKGTFCFAFYCDNQAEERKRGITISCTAKEFFTNQYHYTIIDAPGHRDFIKNMISGASQADVGVLMVPADGGFTTAIAKGNHKAGEIQGQTRQHARLLFLLGIKQLIVCVNKMDDPTKGNYSEERFKEIRDEMMNMLVSVGWNKQFVTNSVPILPISGWQGDNLIKKSEKMAWWKGVDVTVKNSEGKDEKVHVETLLEAFDKYTKIPKRNLDAPARVPISGIYNIKGAGTVVAGRIEIGCIRPDDQVVFIPSHTDTNDCSGKVFSVEMHHKSVPFAGTGDNVGFNIKGLDKMRMPKVGDVMMLKSDTTYKKVTRFTAQVQVLDHPGELKPGFTPIGFVRTARSPVKMTQINWKIGKKTGNQKVTNPPFLEKDEAAEVVFEPLMGLVVEPFDKCEGLGRIAIMDGNSVIMLGKILKTESS